MEDVQTVDIHFRNILNYQINMKKLLVERPLDLNGPVSSLRARFWHQDHFVIDIIGIYLCALP